jgi:hypothetical protein
LKSSCIDGGTISRTQAASAIELKLRQFLKGRFRLGTFLGSSLVQVYDWACAMMAGDSAAAFSARPDMAAAEAIEITAEQVIVNQTGSERDLLLKSLQEALFYATGTDPDISYSEFSDRFVRFLEQRGAASFVQRFLSLALFNLVWFETGESFRGIAGTPDSFEKHILDVERFCQRLAASCWRSLNLMRRPLDLSTALELANRIEKRLVSTQA